MSIALDLYFVRPVHNAIFYRMIFSTGVVGCGWYISSRVIHMEIAF